ncbi:MAG: protein-L-isoaspartate(D-aspartate) O-methyltransferase [Alphaproteobacteria bacterium]
MFRWLRQALTTDPNDRQNKSDQRRNRLAEPILDESIAGTLGQAKFSLGMHLRQQGITESNVLKAMLDLVPRERFLMPSMADRAYEDVTLPIGLGQTISAPFIVALMSQLLEPNPGKAVLEIGTGCGYQAAVLSKLFGHVYSIERHEDLADTAMERLRQLDCTNVSVHLGDGFLGLPDSAPYDGIILTAAPREVPPALVNQLAIGGRLVMPLEMKNGDS